MEKKYNNMTSNCKCNVDTFTLSYGIISAVTSCLGILTGVGMALYLIIMQNKYSGSDFAAFFIIISSWTIPCILIFPYSIILVIGVIKKNYKQVLTYLIFGTIQSIILVAGSISYMIYDKDVYSVVVFVISIVSVFGLACAWITYKRMRMKAMRRLSFNHQHILYAMPT